MENIDDKKENDSKLSAEIEIGEELVSILNGILNNGKWDSSLFLKTVKKRLEDVIQDAEDILSSINNSSENAEDVTYDGYFVKCPEGKLRIYVLLYQTDGAKLVNWQNAIRSLINYNISRPTYTKEEHIKDLIKSKKVFDNYGYVVVDIEKSDFYSQDEPFYDMFKHEMLVLKEKVIKSQNIRGFVHALQKAYAYNAGELIYKGELHK